MRFYVCNWSDDIESIEVFYVPFLMNTFAVHWSIFLFRHIVFFSRLYLLFHILVVLHQWWCPELKRRFWICLSWRRDTMCLSWQWRMPRVWQGQIECQWMSKEVWILIRYMKKFLNSDWLWAVHFFSKYSEKKNNPNFLIFLFFYFSNFLIFLLSKCDLRTRLHNFFMYIMVSRTIWKNIHSWVFQTLVLRSHSILIVFEKLTRAFFFFQIALETILAIHIMNVYDCNGKNEEKDGILYSPE